MLLDLLFEYKQSLRETKKLKAEVEAISEEERTIAHNEDIKQFNSIISHLQFVIEWIDTGRQPYAKRGYDRREVYKRMIPKDPREMDAVHYDNDVISKHITTIDEWDRQRMDDALSVLTEREGDIYMLHHAHLMTYEEIGALLNIKKTTVQTHYERGEKKIQKRMAESLFCLAE
ncbi:sigma-70 family RNA polymerase sigma factor [Pontibacillus salicampi]|uniref:Sigma-70 family RNA polymerase sigma factor n=1 Tax=Pontibacillus salicampi TaxID=1449801 RepID=A0ABV6LU28_9BACI